RRSRSPAPDPRIGHDSENARLSRCGAGWGAQGGDHRRARTALRAARDLHRGRHRHGSNAVAPVNGAPRSPGPGAAGGAARDLAQLRPRDGWWCAVAGAAGLGVYAWRVPPTAQAWDAAWGSAIQGSNALGGIPWICAAVGYAGFAALSLML